MISYPNVKLNLGLNVLRKRPDGYHDLETLFVPYGGFTDVLEIREASVDSISVEGGTWDPHSDLCWKALAMLRGDCDFPAVSISLTKRAPVGAGLGSGSSDCVFTMKMLNEMYSLGLSDADLLRYSARLGSDCPFFVFNRPMIGEGRGELLTPFDVDLSGYDIKVEVPPGVSVSTREAYGGIVPCMPAVTLREALSGPVETWRDALVNDFERSVFPVHPEIAAMKERFYAEGAVYASMSGSGSSVFALFAKK